MKKTLLFLTFLFSVSLVTSQVGIGTIDPKATLEVKGKPSMAAIPDGVIAPNISRAELIAKTGYTTAQTGAIVYVSDLSGTTNTLTNKIKSIGYYYFNGAVWQSMNASVSPFSYGDIKNGIQTTDHNGWVKLDGRLKSSLLPSQQTQATTLGITANLPDATNTYLSQNGAFLGSVSSSNSKTLLRTDLPNIMLNATTNSGGQHNHTTQFKYNVGSLGPTYPEGVAGHNNTNNSSFIDLATSTNGSHTHTATTESLNGGVAQTNIDITPLTMSVNVFIYLGE